MKQTPRVTRIIERAEDIAASYGDDFIGTEHLLLALAREDLGIASSVLDGLDVRGEVERRLRTILESPDYNPEGRAGLRAE